MRDPIERFNAEGLDGLKHHDVVALITRLASAEAVVQAARAYCDAPSASGWLFGALTDAIRAADEGERA